MFKDELRAFLKQRANMAVDFAMESFPNWKASDKTVEELDDYMDEVENEMINILLNDC